MAIGKEARLYVFNAWSKGVTIYVVFRSLEHEKSHKSNETFFETLNSKFQTSFGLSK